MNKLLLVSTMLFAGSVFATDYPRVEERIVELRIIKKDTPKAQEEKKKTSKGLVDLPSGAVCSGSFINGLGDIITAGHCALNADTIYVTTFDDRTYKAEILAISATHDLALLHVDKLNSPHFGPAQEVTRGETIFILGSPLGITNSLSTGIIAKLDGDITLVDCSALPGNSGSAVFNTNGELVGVLTAGYVVGFGTTHLNVIQSIDAVSYFITGIMSGVQ